MCIPAPAITCVRTHHAQYQKKTNESFWTVCLVPHGDTCIVLMVGVLSPFFVWLNTCTSLEKIHIPLHFTTTRI